MTSKLLSASLQPVSGARVASQDSNGTADTRLAPSVSLGLGDESSSQGPNDIHHEEYS